MRKIKIIAVIVTRKGSKRIKNKNTRLFYKKDSLLSLKIKQLKKINEIDDIIVGSDDNNAQLVAKIHKVKFFKRKKIFCDEKSKTPNDMIKNMLSFFSTDVVLWAHCTNPFITEKYYKEAIKKFIIQFKKGQSDSLVSVNKLHGHFYFNSKPLNHNPRSNTHTVALKLKPIFMQDGGIFIREHKKMKKDGKFCGSSPVYFELNNLTGLDINNNDDFTLAKILAKKIL